MDSVPPPIRDVLAARRLGLCLLVRAGSKAYGIEVEGSDDDFAGVFVPALDDFLSLRGYGPDTHAGKAPDFTIHEVGKFCRLALKGNPAVLETLWNPDRLHATPLGGRLVEMRKSFLHRGSLDVYVDYARAQLRKMVRGAGLHAKGGTYNNKFGAHLVRLIHAGLDLAETGEVTVRVPPERASLLMEIRTGRRAKDEVERLARPLLDRLQGAARSNGLPSAPDEDRINLFVVEARKG